MPRKPLFRVPARRRGEIVHRVRAPQALTRGKGEVALHHALLALVIAAMIAITGAWGVRNIAIAHAIGAQVPDVSVWQGGLPCGFWNYQAGGLVKAAGADSGEYTDSQFANNVGCLRTRGMYRGSYYFASPPAPSCCGSGTAEYQWGVQQADDYLNRLNAHGGLQTGEAAMLDLEIGSGEQSTFAAAFLDEFYNATGERPLLYVSLGYLSSHLYNRNSVAPGLGAYPLDIADWYYGLPPAPPSPWTHDTIWQWSDSGNVDGYYPIDLNDWVSYPNWPGKPGTSPSPSPSPAPPPPSAPPPPPGCSFDTSGWTANPWPDGDGNQAMTVYRYGGSVACSSPQYSYGLQVWTGSYWANVCSPTLRTCWDPWTTRSSDTWALSYYATPCNRAYRFMVAIRSGSGPVAAYKKVASWIITRNCG